MEIQKRAAIAFQTLPTILILLISSCLAARQLEYKGAPSPAPAQIASPNKNSTLVQDRCRESENKNDSRSLCTRAACDALQSLDSIEKALTNLQNGPDGHSTAVVNLAEECGTGLSFAAKMTRQAIKEGLAIPPPEYYDYTTYTFNFALYLMKSCGVDVSASPNLHELGEAYKLVDSLFYEAGDICYPYDYS